MNPILAKWNKLHPATAEQEILPCCGSRVWAARLTAARPFATPEALAEASDRIWLALPKADWLEAFATHPRIGERHAAATPQSLSWSAQEQASAGEAATQPLAEANRLYEERFDRTFIVCATGKTPEQMLAILNQRLTNTPEAELAEAAEQQRQITNIRLHKWLNPPARMTISTHILDTSLGRPTPAIPLILKTPTETFPAHTDPDGRHRFTMEPTPGVHTLRFDTAAYYAAQGIQGLYPHVEIAFLVTPGQTHYHIPLLLTANGYTTYRGS